jgi:hypothetical protein
MKMEKQPEQYGPYFRVIKTEEVCEFAEFHSPTEIYDLKFQDGTIRQLHKREVEKIPPHIAFRSKKK